jgi:hypothetical protein
MNHLEPSVTSLLRRVLQEAADDINAGSEARAFIAERLLKAAKAGTAEVDRLKELAVEAYLAHLGTTPARSWVTLLKLGLNRGFN